MNTRDQEGTLSNWQTIAIVDDDVAMREALEDILRSCDYRTQTFVSAEDYLAHGNCAAVDCIVLDVKMPGLSGLELLDVLNARGGRPPVIMLSSVSDERAKLAAALGGAHAYLVKPVDDEELLGSIASALDAEAGKGRKPNGEVRD
jgi:FixJ family two-component response regulator